MKTKKPFFSSHAKSSAMLISLAVHGVLIAIAVVLVVATAIPKTEAPFVPKKITRPKMPPKPVKVPVDTKKRKPKPRLRARILTERKTLVDIRMPETSGVTGGLGNMGGTGNWNLGFEIKMDLFGSDKAMGNELIGTFYDFKQNQNGKLTDVGEKYKIFLTKEDGTSEFYAAKSEVLNVFYGALANFIDSKFNPNRLKNYYEAPKKKYATSFIIPVVNSAQAPEKFGAPSEGCWAIHYTGQIAAPETGDYRFWGYGDDVLVVRVNKRLVLDAGYEPFLPQLKTGWKSPDQKNNRKFPIDDNGLNESRLYVGDWMPLVKGVPVPMEVLIADTGKGNCAMYLLIEKKGEDYRMVPYKDVGSRPVLPVFKTREIPKELHREMKINPNEATLTGPTFNAVPE